MWKPNDKYSALLTSGYTVGQNVLYVSAVPDNVPTIVVAAKGTDNETVFTVTGKTENSLTGVAWLKGAEVDLDTNTPLTCLNNEEFITQFHEAATGKATGAEITPTATEDAKIVTPKAIADSNISFTDAEETLTNKTLTDPVIANLVGNDFWIKDTDTWVYVSATSFKIEGKDVRSRFPKGTKIKLTQTSAKYFYVVGTAFSTDTTITVTGGSDYSLANAAITNPFYSYGDDPQGFPQYFNYSPTWGGFSSNPTSVVARFSVQGNTCHLILGAGGNGTSNATTLTVTVPILPAIGLYVAVPVLDNGSDQAAGFINLVGGNLTASVYKSAFAAFTNSGAKRLSVSSIVYQI